MQPVLAQQQPPSLFPGGGSSDGGNVGDALSDQWTTFTTWLGQNWVFILLVVVAVAALVFLLLWLGQKLPTKGLRRDGLEVFRRDMLRSNTALDVRGKSLWLTGNELLPAQRLGRLKGYCRDVEGMWYAYKRGLFGKVQLLLCNADDIATSHEGREVHVRAVSVRYHRGVYCAVPDVHDPRERAIWTVTVGRELGEPGDLAEAWKEYITTAIDNVVGLDESLLAAQDRHYLRQRVTYSDDEHPAETSVPQPPPATVGNQQGGEPHG